MGNLYVMPTFSGELSRRNFMQAGLVAGAAMAVPWVVGAGYPTKSPAAKGLVTAE
jgi:hypothetical protein